MPERDDLDQLIDSALMSYGEARPGLEQRMLAGIQSEVARPLGRWNFLAVAAPVVASLLLMTYLLRQTFPPQLRQGAVAPLGVPATLQAKTAPTPAPQPVRVARVMRRRPTANQARQSAAVRPKLDVFPTIQPLTDAEEAISRYVREASEADRKALVASQQQATEPLTITAIHIPPLEIPEQDKN
jgi:hypothetical protein